MLTKEDVSRISGVDLKQLDGYNDVVKLCGNEVDGLPDGLNFLGLSLTDCPLLTELPEDLRIRWLDVWGCPALRTLPECLNLAHICLFDSNIENIPKNSYCYSDLILLNCQYIKELPECRKAIMHDFLVEECPNVTAVPDLNIVHGMYSIRGTQVTSLPEQLKVGDMLLLCDNLIETLPKNIKVGTDILLDGCKSLKYLPDGLKVNGDLDLSYTSIKELPKGLIVKGNLSIMGTPITSLPEDLIVGGNILSYNKAFNDVTINHKVLDNLVEQIWEDTDYIYANDKLYRIMAKEDKHMKVLDYFGDTYFTVFGYDNFVEKCMLYLVPDENPNTHAYGVGKTVSEAYIDLILKTADKI